MIDQTFISHYFYIARRCVPGSLYRRRWKFCCAELRSAKGKLVSCSSTERLKLISTSITPALLRHQCKGNYRYPCHFFNRMLWVSVTPELYSSEYSLYSDRYGLVGLLRPLTVYPSEMVYWGVSLRNDIHVKKNDNITPLIESTNSYDFSRYLLFQIF